MDPTVDPAAAVFSNPFPTHSYLLFILTLPSRFIGVSQAHFFTLIFYRNLMWQNSSCSYTEVNLFYFQSTLCNLLFCTMIIKLLLNCKEPKNYVQRPSILSVWDRLWQQHLSNDCFLMPLLLLWLLLLVMREKRPWFSSAWISPWK